MKNKRKKYLPDILVEYHDGQVYLEEVKGYVYDQTKFILKNGMAKWYCKVRKWTYRIIWKDGLDTVD